MDRDRGKPIDLTLKLGPSSPKEQDNQDHRGDNINNNQGPPAGMEIENIDQLNNPPTQDGVNEVIAPPNYFMFYPPYPPQDSGSPSRRVCRRCGSLVTPLWRKGPDGPQTLCNACGLKHLRALKRGAE